MIKNYTPPADGSDIAALLLRLSSGGLFLAHGLIKLFIFTPAGTAGYFQSIGLPGVLGYMTMIVEILGGIALMIGFKTRPVALLLAAVLVGAAIFGHGGNGFTFSNAGGGWEYPVYWAITMIAVFFLGGGKWAVSARS